MRQGIFISYRRDTGSTMARMIYDRVRLEKKYQCFLDVEKLNAGNFREHIAQEMGKCDIFLLILSKNALNRCVNPNDNVRQEIELALEKRLPIIPVMSEDFYWPDVMPQGLESIKDLNGVPYIQVYSEQFFERLYSFIETIRAEEKAKENAIRDAERAARAAELSAKAKEKLKELGRSSRAGLPETAEAVPQPAAAAPVEMGRPPEKPADTSPAPKPENPEKQKKKLPLMIGGAVVVILLAALGISLLHKDTEHGTRPTKAPATAASATAKPGKAGNSTPSPAADSGFQGGASREEAAALPLSAKVNGKFAGEAAWASFRTTGEENVPYYVTLVNLTAGSENLTATILDENGERIRASSTNSGDSAYLAASQQGRACTARFDALKPDMVYYIQLGGKGKAEYALAVSRQDEEAAIATAKSPASPEDYTPATNQDAGPQLSLNTKYNGKYAEGEHWAAFKTGPGEDEKYFVFLENLRAGSGNLYATILDEYGNVIKSSDTSGDDSRYLIATQQGRACYGGFAELKPDSWYYIQIDGKGKAEYSLAVTQGDRRNEIATAKVPATPDSFTPATNQDGGPQLSLNTKYNGKYVDGYQWAAFRTGSEEDETYSVFFENLTAGSENLYATLVSEYGNVIKSASTSGDDSRYLTATSRGRATYGGFTDLKPDTWYYIQIDGKGKAEYSLAVTQGDRRDEIATAKAPATPDSFTPATNQDGSPQLSLNTKYNGKYVDGYQWVAFRTGIEEDAEYFVFLENLTAGSENLYATLVSEYGNVIKSASTSGDDSRYLTATSRGRATYGGFTELKPDTWYYIQIDGKGKAEYSLAVTQGDRRDEIATAKAPATPDSFAPATNQDGGPQLSLNTKYNGKYTEGYQWVAFRTGSEEDETYHILFENLSAGSENLYATLVSEYGNVIKSSGTNGDDSRYLTATSRCRVASGSFNELLPDTWYYIQIDGKGKAEYSLAVVQGDRSGEIATAKAFAMPESFEPAASQDAAPALLLNTGYSGRFTSGYQWVAFRTGSEEEGQYTVTLENRTAEGSALNATIVNEYGYYVKSSQTNSGDSRYLIAKPGGAACFARFDELAPDTWYYIQIDGNSKADYTLTVETELPEGAEGSGSGEAGEDETGDQILPESFLLEMEALAEKRLAGLLVENASLEFGTNDGSTRDVNTRSIRLGDMEPRYDALYFETGGTAAFFLYYQGSVSISEDWAGEYPDAVIAFKLDSFPQKFYSAKQGGDIRYETSDFGVFMIVESKDEYLRRIHGSYQYVDHAFYELVLP